MTNIEHALHLASLGFHIFPIVAGKKAPPCFKDWQASATRDPKLIASTWDAMPNANIGISTSKFGDDEALLVIDVDVKGKKNGEQSLLRLELEGWELPDTFTQRTPTGGRHLVYRVPAPVRQGVNVLGDGLDIRSAGGYVVGAGSTTDAGAYSADDARIECAPLWLIERCGAAKSAEVRPNAVPGVSVDTDRAIERATRYLKDEAPLAVEGEGGDHTTFKVAAKCKDLGLNEAQCCLAMHQFWNNRCSPPWSYDDLADKVRNAYRYGKEPQGIAAPEAEFSVVSKKDEKTDTSEEPVEAKGHPYEELNKCFALTFSGSAHILWETHDHRGKPELKHLTPGEFHIKHENKPMTVGGKERRLSDLWLAWKGRREYQGLVFMPGEEAPPNFYNLWRGFAYEPAAKYEKHPAVEAFIDHARTNVCRGDAQLFRWLIGYFAHLVQKPNEKPLVALVFRGGKGVGKNALIDRVGALLGGHYLLTANRRYLIGNFNSHLENCLLFALDEAFWSGDKAAEGTIKDLITGREHVIEHKGKESYTVANKTRVVIIGNEDWLVPASHDERRFAVFDVGDGRKQDRDYFAAMRQGMESDGGYSQLLRYLLDFNIKGIDVNAAPMTKALLDQKHSSLGPFEQWWHQCLEEGRIVGAEFTEWPAEMDCERFRTAFRRYVKDRNINGRIPEDRGLGRVMKRCCPGVVKRRLSRQGDGSQPYAYSITTLKQCRADWEKFIGDSQEWAE